MVNIEARNRALFINNANLNEVFLDVALKLIKTNCKVHATKLIAHVTDLDSKTARVVTEFLQDMLRNLPTPEYSAQTSALELVREVLAIKE